MYPWLFPTIAGVFGAVLGSFINCMRYRIPRHMPLRQPPSQCDACGYTLQWVDLIPIFSWLILRGKCRKCGTAIGWRSVIVEILCTILAISSTKLL